MAGGRKLIALLCLAALLLAALTPASDGLTPAWLTPFWLFLAILVSFSAGLGEPERDPRLSLSCQVVPSRAPPSA
jgi:hypothetical protein